MVVTGRSGARGLSSSSNFCPFCHDQKVTAMICPLSFFLPQLNFPTGCADQKQKSVRRKQGTNLPGTNRLAITLLWQDIALCRGKNRPFFAKKDYVVLVVVGVRVGVGLGHSGH